MNTNTFTLNPTMPQPTRDEGYITVQAGRFTLGLTIVRRIPKGGIEWELEDSADVRIEDKVPTKGRIGWTHSTAEELLHVVNEFCRYSAFLDLEEAIAADPEKYVKLAEAQLKAEAAIAPMIEDAMDRVEAARAAVLNAKTTGALPGPTEQEVSQVVEKGGEKVVETVMALVEHEITAKADKLVDAGARDAGQIAGAGTEAKAKALLKAVTKATDEALGIVKDAEAERQAVLEAEAKAAQSAEAQAEAAEKQAKLDRIIRDAAARELGVA